MDTILKYTLIVLFIAAWSLILLGVIAPMAEARAPASVVRAALQKTAPPRGTIYKRAWVICHVWPRSRCVAAVHVSYCESTIRPWARNGQYLGAFQMGASERARFGHGRSMWVQARAAHRYWVIAGWGPWSCQP